MMNSSPVRHKPESTLTQREMDLARSVQEVTELVMLRLAYESSKQVLPNLWYRVVASLGEWRVLRKSLPTYGFSRLQGMRECFGAALNVHYQFLKSGPGEASVRVTQDAMRGKLFRPAVYQ
ncbi:MAG: hypothetical protein R3B83_10715 [Nitrospirales bacterium]|nr:hypothetical protein [Nitrospirales bacterium]